MLVIASIEWLEAIPFWILLSIGVGLIAIDLVLTSDNHSMWVGAAVICLGLANALDLPGEAQLVVFAAALVSCLFVVRRLVARLPRLEQAQSGVVDVVNARGSVIRLDPEAARFAVASFPGLGEWRVESAGSAPLAPGQTVRAVRRDGLTLIVDPLDTPGA